MLGSTIVCGEAAPYPQWCVERLQANPNLLVQYCALSFGLSQDCYKYTLFTCYARLYTICDDPAAWANRYITNLSPFGNGRAIPSEKQYGQFLTHRPTLFGHVIVYIVLVEESYRDVGGYRSEVPFLSLALRSSSSSFSSFPSSFNLAVCISGLGPSGFALSPSSERPCPFLFLSEWLVPAPRYDECPLLSPLRPPYAPTSPP